jgi:hypothetical protein
MMLAGEVIKGENGKVKTENGKRKTIHPSPFGTSPAGEES